jgi:hypothetical protein
MDIFVYLECELTGMMLDDCDEKWKGWITKRNPVNVLARFFLMAAYFLVTTSVL